MRRILLVVAVVSSLVIASTASASQNRVASQAGGRKGPVAKLVELEKRKNEWLRQQFLGK